LNGKNLSTYSLLARGRITGGGTQKRVVYQISQEILLIKTVRSTTLGEKKLLECKPCSENAGGEKMTQEKRGGLKELKKEKKGGGTLYGN